MINYNKLGIKYQRGKTLALRNAGVKAAREQVPVKTANLQQNAVYSIATKNGFKIVWDERYAFYLKFVNEGISGIAPNSPKVLANKGFVERGIGAAFDAIQNSFLNYKKPEKHSTKNKVSKTLPLFLTKVDNDDGFNLTRMKYNLKKSLINYNSGKIGSGFESEEESIIYYSQTGGVDIIESNKGGEQ